MHQLTGTSDGRPRGYSLRGSGTSFDGPDETREELLSQVKKLQGRFTDPPHVVKPRADAATMEG